MARIPTVTASLAACFLASATAGGSPFHVAGPSTHFKCDPAVMTLFAGPFLLSTHDSMLLNCADHEIGSLTFARAIGAAVPDAVKSDTPGGHALRRGRWELRAPQMPANAVDLDGDRSFHVVELLVPPQRPGAMCASSIDGQIV